MWFPFPKYIVDNFAENGCRTALKRITLIKDKAKVLNSIILFEDSTFSAEKYLISEMESRKPTIITNI
jgi:hypothetical protein